MFIICCMYHFWEGTGLAGLNEKKLLFGLGLMYAFLCVSSYVCACALIVAAWFITLLTKS
jgi:hypothetical protein